MKLLRRVQWAMIGLLMVAGGQVAAEVKPAGIFTEHMVLQRDGKVPVWGMAQPGEAVNVAFGEQHQAATADAAGKWHVDLLGLKAGGPFVLTISGNQNTVTFKDVLVGEVWLCSGQSNMEWALEKCVGGPEAVAAAGQNRQLRLCTIPHNSQLAPSDDVPTQWVLPSPDTARHFSAIAYWFGSKLQKELGVPIGIINCSYGGTAIESWMPAEVLRGGPWPQDKHTVMDLAKIEYDKRKASKQPEMDQYLAAKADAIREHKPQPPFPTGWVGDFRGPAVLWNGMVWPIHPFAIRGVAWYQGESNAYVGVADTYGELLPAMIEAWRGAWQQPQLPFIVFQIAPNRKPQVDANEPSGIAVLQEAQWKATLKTAKSALVVTMDLGEPDVHYPRKEPAAVRAKNAALALAYGRELEYRSPALESMSIDGETAVIHFTHCGGGLVSGNTPLSGFAIAGEDRKFAFADARIQGDTVIVSSPTVQHPVAVRYGWADLPKTNLFSKEGLPAAPFRTDTWPVTAKGK